MKSPRLAKVVALLLLISFFAGPALSIASPLLAAPSEEVVYHKVEDPRLKTIIHQLFGIIGTLLKMLVTFAWLTKPAEFFKKIFQLFQTLGALLKRLWIVLKEYLFNIDDQIQSSKCHDRDCTNYGTQPHVSPTPVASPSP